MSGGHFSYNQHHINDIADEIDKLVANNGSGELDEFGYLKHRNYPDDIIELFRVASWLCRRAAIYVHRIDYLVSGDDGEENFRKNLIEDLSNESKEKRP